MRGTLMLTAAALAVFLAPAAGLAAYNGAPDAYDHQPAPGTLKEEARQETHAARVEADHARRMAKLAHRKADRAHKKALKAVSKAFQAQRHPDGRQAP